MCEECSFTTTFKSNLVKHRKKIHLGIIERHPCDQCEKVLTSKGNLDVHRKRRHEPKEFRVFSFPCDLCSAGFVTKADRKTHILSRYVCMYYCFSVKSLKMKKKTFLVATSKATVLAASPRNGNIYTIYNKWCFLENILI